MAPPPLASPWKKRLLWALAILLLCAAVSAATWFMVRQKDAPAKTANTGDTSSTGDESLAATIDSVTLDPAHDYGDAYADGLLPVGDKKYVTDTAKKGHVFMCRANFVPESQAGAQTRGPWFVNNNTQWDITKKARVQGSVSWQPNMAIKIENGKRIITTNDLPTHKTGTFPVGSSDPAAAYDRNPNTIKDQSLSYTLTANPTPGKPVCMGGEAGVMLTGVALFNGFDAGGRDAGAWEVQDDCDGHPQGDGEYHYHTLSRCIADVTVQTIIGYALDGFPITGPKVGDKNILTTSDLDVCHGLISELTIEGKKVNTYHYVMTQDFPYSVSCFRATAVDPPHAATTQTQDPEQQKQPPPIPPQIPPSPY